MLQNINSEQTITCGYCRNLLFHVLLFLSVLCFLCFPLDLTATLSFGEIDECRLFVFSLLSPPPLLECFLDLCSP